MLGEDELRDAVLLVFANKQVRYYSDCLFLYSASSNYICRYPILSADVSFTQPSIKPS